MFLAGPTRPGTAGTGAGGADEKTRGRAINRARERGREGERQSVGEPLAWAAGGMGTSASGRREA
eukprot:COSAG02_NODE_141_length_34311_cov_54.733135_24_plen_65_part_00